MAKTKENAATVFDALIAKEPKITVLSDNPVSLGTRLFCMAAKARCKRSSPRVQAKKADSAFFEMDKRVHINNRRQYR